MSPLPARLVHAFEHGSGVHSLAVAANGLAVTGSRDGAITVWDISSRRKRRSFPAGHELFLSLALLQDGKHAVSGGRRRIILWDIETGLPVREIDASADEVKVLATGPGGICFSGHRYGGIIQWDLDTGKRLAALEALEIGAFSRALADSDEVTALALTPDGQRLVAGSAKGFARVWDIWTRRCLHVVPAHYLDVTGITVPFNGLRGISASWDGTVKLWALEKDAASSMLFEGKARINCLALLPGGNMAVWGTEEGELSFLDVANRGFIKTVKAHARAVNRVSVWNEYYFLSASEDGTLKLWDDG